MKIKKRRNNQLMKIKKVRVTQKAREFEKTKEKEMHRGERKKERGTLEVLRRPFSGVVS